MVYARVATPMATSHGKAPAIQTKAKPKANMADAKANAKAKMADAKPKAMMSDLACPFRNLMKYRASDVCKKANNNVEPFW